MQPAVQRPSAPSDYCLQHPHNLGVHISVTLETAVNMLVRAITLAASVPFVWTTIDRPSDGQVYLICVPHNQVFPNDGVRYLDPGHVATSPVAGNRELEVIEDKCGFAPGQDRVADRVRRRFRIVRGGHPQLVLVHYTRDRQQYLQIPPAIANQPVRQYPIREVREQAVFVAGPKQGQRVPATGGIPPSAAGIVMTTEKIPNQVALLAQQNANMHALEQRRGAAGGMQRQAPQPVEEHDSGDEADHISARTLATTRYKRNHELMNEVFMYAAFGDKVMPPAPPSYSELFKKEELDEKVSKLAAEVEELTAKAASRRAARAPTEPELGDVSMESVGAVDV
ncbi:hypothetical protein PUNSTDRAFT_141043 [Punctularia strigosozonata HHB-11173 SS5]|uniref:uncharacterized protein n=1 Tax=Punctularia strigosozonata (strain HHB-11173) TaxID=741275 RepID=UPI0004416DA0|nr:uncharacterized protein PUNSTDRAFT_141043 [Punctularia strigosozonata HHB-11173 SS5]EIN12288.1 hypothetical protein PUNSTDRAFT_141043 [Punctularia strigosozonata HHB-11173 SS5]